MVQPKIGTANQTTGAVRRNQGPLQRRLATIGMSYLGLPHCQYSPRSLIYVHIYVFLLEILNMQ